MYCDRLGDGMKTMTQSLFWHSVTGKQHKASGHYERAVSIGVEEDQGDLGVRGKVDGSRWLYCFRTE